ncbi:MAG: hypothetical protein ACW98F_20115 [Candidatus Hodarchaeales archaeon]
MRVNNGTTLFVYLISNPSPFHGGGYFPFLNKDGDFLQSEYNSGGKDIDRRVNSGVINECVKGSFVGFLARLKISSIMSPKSEYENSLLLKINPPILSRVSIIGK